jgi:hypothetical protein
MGTMLVRRLARHGLAVAGGTLAAVLSEKATSATVPASVLSSTIKAVTLVAGQTAAAGVISVKIAALTEGMVKAMFLNKLMKMGGVLAFFVVIGIGLVGAGWLSYGTAEDK